MKKAMTMKGQQRCCEKGEYSYIKKTKRNICQRTKNKKHDEWEYKRMKNEYNEKERPEKNI
jgi:hypothetical protein